MNDERGFNDGSGNGSGGGEFDKKAGKVTLVRVVVAIVILVGIGALLVG